MENIAHIRTASLGGTLHATAVGRPAARGQAAASDAANLDILRAVAVTLVFVDHSLKFFGAPAEHLNPLGGAGVYMFFVHTSLVLMFSLERLYRKQARGVALGFYLRRFFRIYPLSIFAVAVTAFFSIPQKHIAGPWTLALQPPDLWNTLSNLALSMNLTGHTPILGQLWSLPIEVQMYLVLPLLFLMGRRFGVVGMLVLWVVAAAAGAAQQSLDLPGLWRFSVAAYAPDFVPGVIAYCLWRRVTPRLPSWLWLPAVLAFSALYWKFDSQRHAWVICLALGLSIPWFRQATAPALTRCAHAIAKYSYGVYLGHVFCLWLAFDALRAPVAVQFAVWAVSVVAIPVGAYHLIEKPCIALGGRLADRLRQPVRAARAAALRVAS